MLSVSVAHRVPGGFFEPGFEFDSYLRFFLGLLRPDPADLDPVLGGGGGDLRLLAFPFTVILARMGGGRRRSCW